MIQPDRFTASYPHPFVVFLVGVRINKPWKVHKWAPIALALSRMLKELARHPEAGLLSGEMWFGRTMILLQYWRSLELLLAYANAREARHFPAGQAFSEAVGASGDVGLWHETYMVIPGGYENIYINMPPFGLGRVGNLHKIPSDLRTAEARIKATKE
jgi:hypothetical protein